MHQVTKQKLLNGFILILLLLFTYFVFFNLNWGAPFYFHPDERNIASSITQLNFSSLHPHFFAYGQLPIYLVYGLGIIGNLINHIDNVQSVAFDKAIVIGRLLSALLTLFVVFLTYKFTKEVTNRTAAKLSIIFSTTSVAYLQYSHFSTFEMWITFFSLLMSYFYFHYIKEKKDISFIAGSIILGLLCGLKISSIVLFIIPTFALFASLTFNKNLSRRLLTILKLSLYLTFFSIVSYLLTSPFNLLDINGFISSMKYESGVATGSLPVFYTGSFFNQIPIIFQFRYVFPFLINPLMTLLLIPSLIFLTYVSIKKKNFVYGFIVVCFIALFVPSAIVFAKWTRYIVPAVPFTYMMIAILLMSIQKKISKKTYLLLIVFMAIFNIIFAFSFIKTVRLSNDTRIESLQFAKKNISQQSQILSEVYDLGIIPYNGNFPFIYLYNFYELDNGEQMKKSELSRVTKSYDYFILPSQRVYKSRTINSKKFPIGNNFYTSLFNNKQDFKKIYQTPCDIFCKLTYMGDPVFGVEETVNVFDRPMVYIFKKQ